MVQFLTMNEAYHTLFELVKDFGFSTNPRGKKCTEVRPGAFRIIDSRKTLYTGKTRNLNYAFFAIETLCYIGGLHGREHAYLMCNVNPNMIAFLNEQTHIFDGAYGKAIGDQLPIVADILEKDKWSRQAIINIWSHDTKRKSKDVPCTCVLQFFVEPDNDGEDCLSMSVYMRSNDLNWGVPYDVPAFASIQMILAATLGMAIGRYNHTAGSLHFYDNDTSQSEKPPNVPAIDAEEWSDRPEFEYLPIPIVPHTIGIDGYAMSYIHTIQSEIRSLLSHITLRILEGDKLRNIQYPPQYMNNQYLAHWISIIAGKSNR